MDTTFVPLWPDNACPYCVNGVQHAYDQAGRVIAAWECPDCSGTGIASERQPVESAAD